MTWQHAIEKASPSIVRIETPDGGGTGFVCCALEGATFVGVATAYHVVARADYWHHPIRMVTSSGNTILLTESERTILHERDSAIVTVPRDQLEPPGQLIPLLQKDWDIPVGWEVGWLGFPEIRPLDPCLLLGSVSFRAEHFYLLDGVGIRGVSGGTVLVKYEADPGEWRLNIVGSVSAYLPGQSSPLGLMAASDVSSLHEKMATLRSEEELRQAWEKTSLSLNELAALIAQPPK